MKIAALLCGLLASAFAWGASFFLIDLSVPFLALWPSTNSQQLFGLAAWHGLVGLAVFGGLVAVVAPLLGALLLFGAAGAWVWVGLTFPMGFAPQVVVPLAFAATGGIAALGALFRRRSRRTGRGPDFDEVEREEALRLEPDDELARAVDVRQARREPRIAAAATAVDEAIGIPTSPPPQSTPPSVPALFVVNLAVLLLLTGAVAALLYVSYRNGQLGAAFGVSPIAAATSNAPSEPVADTATVAVATPAEQQTGDTGATTTEVRVSSLPLDLSLLPPQQWTDPFAYCAAVGTMDFPDHRYTGPRLAPEIAAALRVPASSPPDRARWRCADGQVLACRSFRGVACALTPSNAEMRAYCAQNPNATDLWAPNGTWSCVDTVPERAVGTTWPTDSRGFLPGAWVAVTTGAQTPPT